MTKNKKKVIMDAILVGSVDWKKARSAAIQMTRSLDGEVADLEALLKDKDAYSPMAWLNICQQLRIVTDGMTVMRMLAEGKTPKQIANETGIRPGSIAAYQAWNTMYRNDRDKYIGKKIALKGRSEAEKRADAEFLRSCGIDLDVVVREGETEHA